MNLVEIKGNKFGDLRGNVKTNSNKRLALIIRNIYNLIARQGIKNECQNNRKKQADTEQSQ
jgi:hypothetical protein